MKRFVFVLATVLLVGCPTEEPSAPPVMLDVQLFNIAEAGKPSTVFHEDGIEVHIPLIVTWRQEAINNVRSVIETHATRRSADGLVVCLEQCVQLDTRVPALQQDYSLLGKVTFNNGREPLIVGPELKDDDLWVKSHLRTSINVTARQSQELILQIPAEDAAHVEDVFFKIAPKRVSSKTT